jgi:hypothetical protein
LNPSERIYVHALYFIIEFFTIGTAKWLALANIASHLELIKFVCAMGEHEVVQPRLTIFVLAVAAPPTPLRRRRFRRRVRQPATLRKNQKKKNKRAPAARWGEAARARYDYDHRSDIYHCSYYYCYLLLMIVYVGIGRASLLINIVRFDLGQPWETTARRCSLIANSPKTCAGIWFDKLTVEGVMVTGSRPRTL